MIPMNHTVIPAGYEPALSLYETQAAISLIKRTFQDHLAHPRLASVYSL